MRAYFSVRRRLDRGASLKTVIAAAVITALVTVPVAAWAGHQFSDVPDSHTFHPQITAMKNAGIAGGYGDGTYRPDQGVTRAQMAAFLERGLGRVDHAEGAGHVNAASLVSLAQVTVEAGANASGSGFVVVEADVDAYTYDENTCPCHLSIEIWRGSTEHAYQIFDVSGDPNGSGYAAAAGGVRAVVPIPADASHTYVLKVRNNDSNSTGMWASGAITAEYFPLSGDGDNSL